MIVDGFSMLARDTGSPRKGILAMRRHRVNTGFTLIELLVVISIPTAVAYFFPRTIILFLKLKL